MVRYRSAVALLAATVLCSGCLELVRRPSGSERQRTTPDRAAPTASQEVGTAGNPAPTPAVGIERAAAPAAYAERSSRQRRSVKRVNEYALWCIENDMWNEARSHMERALDQDSLSASLHNNLGIVYERLGQTDKASTFYQRALQLNPGEKAYQINLQELQERQQALADTSEAFDLFRPNGRDGRRVRPGDGGGNMPPAFTGE